MTAFNTARGVTIVLLMFLSSFLGTLFLLVPLLPLLCSPQTRAIYRAAVNYIGGAWLCWASLLLESPVLGGVRVVLHGEWPASKTELALVLSNHRCRLDWLFLWCLFRRLGHWSSFGTLANLKIVLKEPLKKLPGFGWAMQFLLFAFIHRDWARDRSYMTRLLGGYFTAFGERVTVLLFPEGTDSMSRADFEARDPAPNYTFF